MDNISKTKELFYRNEKYFEEIFAAYEGLLAEEPDNFEYVRNYLKTLENVWAYHIEAQQFEKNAYFMGKIVQNYGKAFKIQPDNEELFDNMDKNIKAFKNYCLLFKEARRGKRGFRAGRRSLSGNP